MNIVAIDVGFGATKVAYKKGQFRYAQFVSAIGEVKNELADYVKDGNSFEFEDKSYYLFNDAVKLPKDKLLNISNYEELRIASPIIIRYLLKRFDIDNPDLIVLGLSLSMINKSKDYREFVATSLNLPKEKIQLVPQGVGAIMSYNEVGLNDDQDNSGISKNYFGIDIGFNTLDVFQVINGKTSSNTVKGFENEGVIKVANKIIDSIKEQFGRTIDVQEAKRIIESGKEVYRSQEFDHAELRRKVCIEYLKELIVLIEDKFSNEINKMDNLLLVGGGASLLKEYEEDIKEELNNKYPSGFLLIPNEANYYNVLGYWLAGKKILEND